jgi:kinesin family protein 4/21/27
MGTDIHGEAATSDSQRTGIIPRAVKQIFSEVQKRTKAEQGRWKSEAKNSYIEIYNEDLIDLLAGDLDVGEICDLPMQNG